MTSLAQIARDVQSRTRARAREDRPERELSHHIAVADVLRRFARDDVIWFHPANGEHRDKRTAAKLRAMGVQPGAPDFVIIVAGRVYMLEMGIIYFSPLTIAGESDTLFPSTREIRK